MKPIHRLLDFVRYITTARDNRTPDILRVLGVLLGLQFIINSGWALTVEQPWDPAAYGGGAAALLAALGAAMRFARPTEPPTE